MADQYDLLVIGAGPGGYVAAIRGAQLGMKMAIVEREHMAGICSNWGCIPTKALLRSAESTAIWAHAKDYGLTAGEIRLRPRLVSSSVRAALPAQMNNGVQFLMKKNKIDIIWGEATITKPGEIKVAPTKKPIVQPQGPVPKNALGEGTYKAKNIIIATGARPRVLPGIEPDGDKIWTYFEALKPAEMPKSLVVMGSGAIGIEFASLLPLAGRRSDCHRVAAADPAGGRCRDFGLARKRLGKARHQDPDGSQGRQGREDQDGVVAPRRDRRWKNAADRW